MSQHDRQESLERGAVSDLWRNTLSQIPSVFGRLVYLCSLRDANSGAYQHHGLAQVFGEEEAGRVLRESHQQVFSNWLCFPLEEQKADLEVYFSGLGEHRRTILETWSQLTPYQNLVPSTAREVERQLYFTDLETILELLRGEYGVASPDPNA